MATKITIAEQYAQVEKFLRENGKNSMADFIAERCELHTKRNSSKSSKPTKAQTENEGLKEKIIAEMVEGEKYTISDMQKKLDCCLELSNQKVLALVLQLKTANLVTRTEEKGKAYYSLA